jgi:transcriptional regulator with GAF, ATPase, and Fis domain
MERSSPECSNRSRDVASDLEALDSLLSTLTDVLDIREVFDRVSNAVQPILPHDVMGVVEVNETADRFKVYAGTGLPTQTPQVEGPIPDPEMLRQWDALVLDDVQTHIFFRKGPAIDAGMKSVLSVAVRFAGRLQAGVNFFSREYAHFSGADIPIARRIASYIALIMSHHRLAEEGRVAAEATARASRLESTVHQLTDELDANAGYRSVIGESAAWRDILKKAAQVAAVETTVLLLGESGTGKEVIARFIHRGSARRDGRFIALNCAALPDNLLESELFGYERGAFTGAVQNKPGLIEQAAGGTLFLDEVGEMALPAQAKFLRVLQEREFQRLGGTRVLKADVRVVAATNRDLHKAVEQRQFRDDLYFRLNVFELRLLPLRERPEDIPLFIETFVKEIGRSIGRPPAGISREAKQALLEYHWPGNIRELRNALERAAILADGGLIVADHLALTRTVRGLEGTSRSLQTSGQAVAHASNSDIESTERDMIEQALQRARFNKSVAAKTLGLTRAQLYTRLKRHGLE